MQGENMNSKSPQAILERSSQVKESIRIVREDRNSQDHQKKRVRTEQATN